VTDRRIARFIPRLRTMLHDTSLAAQPRLTPLPVAPTPSQSTASLLLGIGIITYNRRLVLSETLDRVQQHTKHQRTVIAVADDGSTDGTLDMLRARQVQTVTGRNMSIAWNKNRALFLLSELLRCDVVVLLEDDAYPSQDHWEAEWMRAAVRLGHANVAGPWLREHFVSGTGTAEDPILSRRVTAQCSVFSREALLFGGYFDSRFRGYGHEHVEHTRRLIRMGYGGVDQSDALFHLLLGGLSYHSTRSSFDGKMEQVEENRKLADMLFGDFGYRAPWRNEAEAKQFRDEMRSSFPRAAL
jgi:glycosyltransferase involved in cell wall biosynthesis